MFYCLYQPKEIPIPIFAHRFETRTGYEINVPSGDRLEITMVDAGESLILVDGRPFDSKVGTINVWPPRSQLHYRVEGLHAHSTASVPCGPMEIMDEERARAFAADLPAGAFLIPLHADGDLNEAAKLLRRVITYTHSGDPAAGLAAGGAFLQLCAELTRQSVQTLTAPDTTSAQIRYCRTVTAYIAKHYHEEFSLDDLAAEVGLSPNYLCALFRKTTGQTVVQYLTRYRLEMARGLLQSTNLSVSAVSAAVGYRDAAYFTRLFTREEKITPSQVRRGE